MAFSEPSCKIKDILINARVVIKTELIFDTKTDRGEIFQNSTLRLNTVDIGKIQQ